MKVIDSVHGKNLTNNLLIKSFARSFHASRNLYGTQVREKLLHLQKHKLVLNKTTKELNKLHEKKRQDIKKLQKTAYSKQHALKLLKERYSIKDDELAALELGPLSKTDLKYLTLTKDKRMIYTILGITGEQLRDSKLIDDTIKSFLKRDQVEKAIFVARLGKTRSAAGLNSIITYYLEEIEHPQSALDIYNWGKKWGIPLNEYTHTVLFSGLSNQKYILSKEVSAAVFKIIENLIEKNEINQIEFNSSLGALSNSKDVTPMFELFEKEIHGIKRDAITYTWAIRGSSKIESDSLFIDLVNELLLKIPKRCIDSKLLFELCKVLNSRCSDEAINKLVAQAIEKYFDIELPEKYITREESKLNLPELSHWGILKRFPSNQHIVGLLLANSLKSKNYKFGIDLFNDVSNSQPYLVDLDMYHKTLSLIIKENPSTCADECLNLFDKIENNTAVRFSRHTIVLLYKSFEQQAAKGKTQYNDAAIDKLISSCLTFMKAQEGIKSDHFKSKVLPRDAYKFLFKIVQNANRVDKMKTETIGEILDEYLKSICENVFVIKGTANGDLSIERYLSLEGIRIVKTLIDRYNISDIKTFNDSPSKVDREQFLLRRLLLRLKSKLLDRIKFIEKKKLNNINAELDDNIKQLSRLILKRDFSSVDSS